MNANHFNIILSSTSYCFLLLIIFEVKNIQFIVHIFILNLKMDSKKKLSGSEFRKRRLEKEAATLQNTQNIRSFFSKGLRFSYQCFVFYILSISSYELLSISINTYLSEPAESNSEQPNTSDFEASGTLYEKEPNESSQLQIITDTTLGVISSL